MTTFLHVMICYHYYQPNAQFEKTIDAADSLGIMTAPFKMAFERVFGEVRVRNAQPNEVSISSVSGKVDRIYIFESDKARLNGTERDDYVVYYRMAIADEISAGVKELLTTNSGASLKERESVVTQVAGNDAPPRLTIFTRYPGHCAWISETCPEDYSSVVACISVFYFYAWILALRIERNQLTQDISPQIKSGDIVVRQIIDQRMRLLNLERYFLLGDRTNDSLLRNVCTELSERFLLAKRYRRMSARHIAFETHIDNTSKALQAQRAASLTKMVFLLTVLSVPFAAMQVLFGINPDSAIYQKAKDIFSDPITYLVASAAFAAVMLPMIFPLIYDLIRSRFRRRRIRS
jgi:hypothetical protein